MRRVLVTLVKGYRLLLSPWLGASCRFEPTCSAYAIEALERHGAIAGTGLTLYRIIRCQPWCQGGHDPVPDLRTRSRSGTTLFTSLLSSDASSDKKSSS
ncbi:membrane protein insertion efficiency factor YidD [Pseudomonas sp.]|jgi:putative membrane protein insertion efficiency factor|uniref:membrane protein insertion efficiency factor YidD n=1 Tax=Pseudomonas sp. TaxID=306 RepID=UPI0025F15930|nr:membrane protein insertion efficiency factor YidD [Pseudomonas sp.]